MENISTTPPPVLYTVALRKLELWPGHVMHKTLRDHFNKKKLFGPKHPPKKPSK